MNIILSPSGDKQDSNEPACPACGASPLGSPYITTWDDVTSAAYVCQVGHGWVTKWVAL